MSETDGCPRGKVYLVGAGPGDPGLITLRGAQRLREADVVLYDYLVNSRILSHVRPGTETFCLGRHGYTRIWSQEEINAKLIQLAREGKTVVRLKNGDPTVFGRCAEEAEALAEAGIVFELVPGITAALAAASYAGIPVTDRRLASAVALVTGQEDQEKEGQPLDYAALARFPGTLVFYMGVLTAPRWTAALMAAGKPPETPAAIIRHCSLPDQQVIECTLDQVARWLAPEHGIRPPVIVIVGAVAQLAKGLGWFQRRPLVGRRIMVTRPEEQAERLVEMLDGLGAEVLVQPAIEIGPPEDWGPVDAALGRLAEFDWLVFSSSNGVRYLLERLLASGRDMRALASLRIAAIGPGTAAELARYHLRADLQPEAYRAESLGAALAPQARGKRFLLARAGRGREVLSEQLQAAGAEVEQVVVYRSSDTQSPRADAASLLSAGKVDYVTVTSSAIARALVRLFGDALRRSRLASISPVTSATLRELGFPPCVEAQTYTMEGVVAAILRDVREASLSLVDRQ